MTVKRCNHCQTIDGQGVELSKSENAACPQCSCMWDINGLHQIDGKVRHVVDGKVQYMIDGRIQMVKCDFPQPQNWSNDPLVKMQQIDSRK